MIKTIKNLLSIYSPLSFWLLVWRRGQYIGQDFYGNKYYEGKARKGYNHPRRWVVYSGSSEASTIPPEWHGWMHHQTDIVPDEEAPSFRRSWQKMHTPNLTGTDMSYRPAGHEMSGGQRAKATGDYEAWKP